MIIKKSLRKLTEAFNLKGGEGSVEIVEIACPSQTFDHTKMYSNLTLKKGSSLGYHNHINETEIILINSGVATYKDDENEYLAYEGDVLICEEGHYHSIKNDNDQLLKITALIIKK